MCDAETDRDLASVSRRNLGLIAGSLGMATAFPARAAALPITEKMVSVKTPDGTVDCHFAAPAKGKHPGVIVWPDIYGLRPAVQQLGQKLAESGYAVLSVNPFYRSAKAPTSLPDAPRDEASRAKIGEMRKLMTPEAIERDAKALVAFLDKQKSVNAKRKIGTTGYCMGGGLIMRTAAEVPSRIGAAASFHGGGLATANPDSPHLLIPKMKAAFLFAVAENDDKRNPTEKDKLREACAAAGLLAEIEVYEGTLHGWCMSDGPAWNPPAAERAWGRMLALFGKALA